MNCENFETWLDGAWERRERPGLAFAPAELQRHVESCEECRQSVELHERLFDGLSSEIPSLSPNFARAVIARFSESARSAPYQKQLSIGGESSWLRRQSAIWLSIAAGLLLAAFTVLWSSPETAPIAERPSEFDGEKVAVDVDSEDQHVAADEVWDPSSQMQSLAMFLLSPPDLKTMVAIVNRRVLALLGDPAQRVQQLPGGLRQVANSVNVTIDLLRNALPGNSANSSESIPGEDGKESAPQDSPATPATPDSNAA